MSEPAYASRKVKIECNTPQRSVGRVPMSLCKALSSYVDKPFNSVMHGQCSARHSAAFIAAGHHCFVTGTKLYCSVTEVPVCEQLASRHTHKCSIYSVLL